LICIQSGDGGIIMDKDRVEGKVQNAWGKVKDAVKKPGGSETTETEEEEKEVRRRERAASE